MFYTYILKSEKDGKYYYGSTDDLDERLGVHNQGEVRATKGRRPLVLHYSEEFKTRSEAFRREQFFQTINGYIWLKNSGII
jgi:putative endonuclease